MLSLINRSHYSLGFGSLTLEEIIEHAKTQPEKTAALTDMNTVSGIPEFLAKCEKAGVKGLAGVTLRVGFENEYIGDVVLIANDATGFDAINDLLTGLEQDEKMSYCGLTDIGRFSALPKGTVTLLDGFPGSVLQRHGAGYSNSLVRAVNDGYTVSLTPSSITGVVDISKELPQLSTSNLSLVETSTAVYSPKKNMSMVAAYRYKKQLSYMNLVDDNADEVVTSMTFMNEKDIDLWRNYNRPDFSVRNKYGLVDSSKFTELPDVGVLSNSNRVEPLYDETEGQSFEDFLRSELQKYLDQSGINDTTLREKYFDRLDEELKAFSLVDGGMVYIRNCKEIFDIGKEDKKSLRLRGSSSASLALFLLVEEGKRLDPIEHGLSITSFNRFMGQRSEMTDVDMDVSDVKGFTNTLINTFGEENVVALKVYSGIQSPSMLMEEAKKCLLNTLERGESHYDKAFEKFKKLFSPYSRKCPAYMSYDEFLQIPQVKNAYRNDDVLYEMIALSRRFQGLYVKSGFHQSGVLFSKKQPASKNMATMRVPKKQLLRSELTHYAAPLVGEIKYDALLASKTGAALDLAESMLFESTGSGLREDLYDPSLYKAVQLDALDGIFQMSGEKTRETVRAVQPQDFVEVAACISLAKAPTFVKNGESDIERYLRNKSQGLSLASEHLVPYLKETHGVILFDDQVIDICRHIGGFNFTDADAVRSALKKKRHGFVDEMKAKFVAGAQSKGISKSEAELIYSEIERKKNSYTMPKSHALNYAKVSMEQVHLKLYHPNIYMTVYGKELGIDSLRKEYTQKLGYKVRPLDVTKTPTDGGLKVHKGTRYIVEGLNGKFSNNMVDAIVKSREQASFNQEGIPNVISMMHSIAENYLGRPLPDISIQNDNKEVVSLISDMIKLTERGGFNTLLSDNIDDRSEELKSAVPEILNKIVTGRNLPVVQNDKRVVVRSR